jgi:phospholipid/cholesterol/gamma-HCH transport system ATP-binding protein
MCLGQGDVIILGKKRKGLLMDDPELADRMKIGLVFQNGALFDSLTVGENVGFQLIEHTTLPPDRIKVCVSK